jgi:O-antigen/teichoic acid export membrane protein
MWLVFYMANSITRVMKKQFAIIAFARYYNLLVEYLLLVATAILMSSGGRGEFVMYVSVITFFSLIASLAYEQFGAAIANKYTDEFDERNFFTILVFFTLIVGICAVFFSFCWLKASVITSLLVGINVVAMNIGKQSIVFFQISNNVSHYFKIFILYKSLHFVMVAYAALTVKAIDVILFLVLVPNILFLFTIGFFSERWLVERINIPKFLSDFSRVKFLYLTALITACYSFVDLYIIYTKLDPSSLSAYNLAMQLNMAVAVIGQAYNINIYSLRGKQQDISVILSSMHKINLLIMGLSVFCIGFVHINYFSLVINFIFGSEYEQLPIIIQSTIWLLPASLVSMFYAPIWISSERYLIMMVASVCGLLLFTVSALVMVSKGIQGIIYAQYLTAFYSVLVNIAFYIYVKSRHQILNSSVW